MQDAVAIKLIKTKYCALVPLMDERMRRQWAASEATAYGWGGIQAVAQATGLSPTTIRKGQAELATRAGQPKMAVTLRLRRPGAGRKCKCPFGNRPLTVSTIRAPQSPDSAMVRDL